MRRETGEEYEAKVLYGEGYAHHTGPGQMHQPIPEQGRWLKQVVTGFFDDHAVPTNFPALAAFRHHVTAVWLRSLRRRGQKDRMTGSRITKLAEGFLPKPRILHLLARAALTSALEAVCGNAARTVLCGGAQQ